VSEQDRFELYQSLLASAAAQLGCETTAEKAKDLACIRMMRESITLNLIAGRNVDPSQLRWLIEELAKFAPPEPPIKVEIEIVDPDPPKPPPDTPTPTPPAPPPTSDDRGSNTTSKPSEPSNVIPLKRTPEEEREHVLRACAPPLKRQNEPWRGHVGPVHDPYGGVNPFGTSGPIPNFGAPYRGR
jgi:outer membrane biosynthesis protein TonB